MTSEADRIDRSGRSGRLRALVLGTGLIWLLVMPAAAQMFSDRPPPVPPGLVPERCSSRHEFGAAFRLRAFLRL